MIAITVHPRKKIFDTIRTMLKRGLHQAEVETLDQALNRVSRDQQGSLPQDCVTRGSGVPRIRRPKRSQPVRISAEGTALIRRFEGCARARRDGLIEAYPDPGTGAQPWTIGWGATGEDHVHGGRIGPGTVWTQSQCDARLANDLKRYARDVVRAIGDAPTTQGQFDAMVSFHYNTGAIARATLTRKHKAGDHEGAAQEFRRWNKAGGRVLKGLTRRRSEEEQLYRKG